MYATYTRIKSTTGYNVGAFCDNLPKSALSFLAIPTTDTENTQRYDIGEARERNTPCNKNHNGGTCVCAESL